VRKFPGADDEQRDPSCGHHLLLARGLANRQSLITVWLSLTAATLLFTPHLFDVPPPERWMLLAVICAFYLRASSWLQRKYQRLSSELAELAKTAVDGTHHDPEPKE
jgi:hypothetical protein